MGEHEGPRDVITLFLCGDVMTGRGVDQILPQPNDPRLEELFVSDARDYVALAESASGPLPRRVEPSYIWGDAIAELDRVRPDARIINLETSITTSEDRWPLKGIHYRMHPANIACLTTARVDVAVLANNHVADYGERGLVETLDTLERAGIAVAGAGRNLDEAQSPAVVQLSRGSRVLVFGCGTESSGVIPDWKAGVDTAGLDVVSDVSEESATSLARRIASVRAPNDLAVVSIHWGGNWGYDVPLEHTRFARRLIDEGVDLVHGHSSHHPRPFEVYRRHLILYGCGDFLNDYEGIEGYESFRGDLTLMYFAQLTRPGGELIALQMSPMQIKRMRLHRASVADTEWLCETLNRINAERAPRIRRAADGTLSVPAGL